MLPDFTIRLFRESDGYDDTEDVWAAECNETEVSSWGYSPVDAVKNLFQEIVWSVHGSKQWDVRKRVDERNKC